MSRIVSPSISLAQIPCDPSVYTISGNEVTYSGSDPSYVWAFGAPINQLSAGALNLTISDPSTSIGICNQATLASFDCTDTCPYT